MIMYEYNINPITNEIVSIIRVADNICIPFDENNTDYQDYLQWLADGNSIK
jgi:hypothetical protein